MFFPVMNLWLNYFLPIMRANDENNGRMCLRIYYEKQVNVPMFTTSLTKASKTL